jgi:hypothetical protein
MLASELMKTLTLAVLATALAAQPAPEDPGGWKAAKWGMTEDEVLAALSGQAARLPGLHKDGTASVAIEPLIIAGHDFRVTFVLAKSGGLIRVAVMPTENNPSEVVFEDLRKALIEQHGAPASSQSTRDGPVLRQVVKWDFPTTSAELTHTFSPAIRNSVILLLYERKGDPENRQLHAAMSGADSSNWTASQRTDGLTGQVRTEFTLRGKYIEAPSRNTGSPSMRVRCAVGKRPAGKTYAGGQFLEAYADFGVMTDSQPAGILVHYRIDDGKVIDQFWTRSTDFRAGFFGDKELASFLYGKRGALRDGDALTPVRKVVVAAPEYLAVQIVVQFDMPDPKEVAESCGLMIHNEPGKK